jgi:hypothetical protein
MRRSSNASRRNAAKLLAVRNRQYLLGNIRNVLDKEL